jgi:hypothetical protein
VRLWHQACSTHQCSVAHTPLNTSPAEQHATTGAPASYNLIHVLFLPLCRTVLSPPCTCAPAAPAVYVYLVC